MCDTGVKAKLSHTEPDLYVARCFSALVAIKHNTCKNCIISIAFKATPAMPDMTRKTL